MTTYSFTLRVVDADGRVATLNDSITVANAPVGVTPVVTLQNRSIFVSEPTVQGTARTVSASLTLSPDGRLSTSEGFTSSVEWGTNTVASNYEVRFTPTGGATFTGAPTGAWLSLSAARTWGDDFTSNVPDGLPAAQLTSGTLEIRNASTLAILATATITFDLRITAIPAQIILTDRTFFTEANSLTPANAVNFNTVTLEQDGRLSAWGAVDSDVFGYVPNEWGIGQNPASFEARCTLLSLSPLCTVSAGTVFDTWSNLSLGAGYGIELNFNSIGEYDTTSQVRVEIRPIGGAVIATAVHTLRMFGYRYPDGIIP